MSDIVILIMIYSVLFFHRRCRLLNNFQTRLIHDFEVFLFLIFIIDWTTKQTSKLVKVSIKCENIPLSNINDVYRF